MTNRNGSKRGKGKQSAPYRVSNRHIHSSALARHPLYNIYWNTMSLNYTDLFETVTQCTSEEMYLGLHAVESRQSRPKTICKNGDVPMHWNRV